MNSERLSQLRIDPAQKRRPRGTVFAIFIVVGLVVLGAATVVYLRSGGERRVRDAGSTETAASSAPAPSAGQTQATGAGQSAPTASASRQPVEQAAKPERPAAEPGVLLTVSGYIINRERIEVSPRAQGVVEWIGVRKGDKVGKGQVVVRLEDGEQRARVRQAEAAVAVARVGVARADLAFGRARSLRERQAVSAEVFDEASLSVDAAKATLAEAEAQLSLARTYLDWTVITSPIEGVVLEKLVEAGELVVPMSFGGGRGPSTALVAVADPSDLQVELDINESDLSKIARGGRCRVTPEAYPEIHYNGVVAEIAPEANRQKGTLQVRVQILKPDAHLTPELTAKVEFLP